MCKEIQKNKDQQISRNATIHADEQNVQIVQNDMLHQNLVEQQMPDQLQMDLAAILQEDDSIADVQLVQATPVFTSENNSFSKQFDPKQLKQSKTKSGRKQAAINQKEADHIFATSLQSKINSMADTMGDVNRVGSEITVKRSILEGIGGTFKNIPERKDITGHFRRKNAKKYEGSGASTRRAREAAREDVDNLVNNLHRDICLEGDTSIPENMKDFTDAYYFIYQFGETSIKQKKLNLKEQKEKGTVTEQKLQDENAQLGKMSEMILWARSCGSGFTVNMKKMEMELQALKLAKQQLLCERTSDYHRLMIELLDKDIAKKQTEYDNFERGIRTVSGKIDSPQGIAQMRAVEELATLRRRMQAKDATEEEKQQCEDQARNIIQNFNW